MPFNAFDHVTKTLPGIFFSRELLSDIHERIRPYSKNS